MMVAKRDVMHKRKFKSFCSSNQQRQPTLITFDAVAYMQYTLKKDPSVQENLDVALFICWLE